MKELKLKEFKNDLLKAIEADYRGRRDKEHAAIKATLKKHKVKLDGKETVETLPERVIENAGAIFDVMIEKHSAAADLDGGGLSGQFGEMTIKGGAIFAKVEFPKSLDSFRLLSEMENGKWVYLQSSQRTLFKADGTPTETAKAPAPKQTEIPA